MKKEFYKSSRFKNLSDQALFNKQKETGQRELLHRSYRTFCSDFGIEEESFTDEFIKEHQEELKLCLKHYEEKNGLKLTHSHGKRSIIPITSIEELYERHSRKKHFKYSYSCAVCGRQVITGFKILDHFKNLLCKRCRRAEPPSSSSTTTNS